MTHPSASEMESHYRRNRIRSNSSGGIIGVLALMAIFLLPVWPYSSSWGYFPALAVGALFLIGICAWLAQFFFSSKRPQNQV